MGEAWMSYAEGAKRLGMKPEAFRHLAKRRGWRKRMANDGRAQVLVPDGEAARPKVPADDRSDARAETSGEVDALRELAGELRAERDRLLSDMERDRTLWAAERSRLEAAAERERAERIEERARLRAELDRATARLAEIEGRGWWRRLRGR